VAEERPEVLEELARVLGRLCDGPCNTKPSWLLATESRFQWRNSRGLQGLMVRVEGVEVVEVEVEEVAVEEM